MSSVSSIKTPGLVSAPPCFHAELRFVCYATLSGHVIILEMSEDDDGLDFSEQTAYKAKDPIFSAPQWMGNEVLFPTVEGRLQCLSKTGPSILEKIKQKISTQCV